MKINGQCYVAIEFVMSLDSGEEVDRTEPGKPLSFIYNAGQMLPGLEKKLEGMEVDQQVRFSVESEEGFGSPRPELVREVAREKFPPDVDIRPGMVFQSEGPNGNFPFQVQAVSDDTVTIDLNHPLCGERLHFDVKVVEVREASESEIQALEDDAGGSPPSP